MKRLFQALMILSFAFTVQASVPTEEGLLKNLNNADLPGQYVTVKMMVQSLNEPDKMDYVKLQLSLDNPNTIGMLQTVYSNGQMLNSQIKSVKYIPDLLTQIRREKAPEKSMFYGVLMMLTTNRSQGVEAFLEKNGVSIVKNKTLLNEDKMKLLRAYRTHLVNSKGRGDAGSPLNPEDPKTKEKVLELFRSNTFKRARNIELVKKDNEFMWKVDWKSAQGYFSNEERQFRAMDYGTADAQIKLEASNYLLFNGTNELPKFMNMKDSTGGLYKIQTLGLDVKKADKRLADSYEEMKKAPGQADPGYSFLF
ncbi:hypothetical protein DOM21_00220 [Bacteriovorax stolpii]|uniref:Uncharacterized protein n=1 Tax=Bacteriovorax stolpii TaxID=960 RepID=A0A2K9NX53_BACTC|nr:hypothetical protein [Bacteriovorax stolpii]AUO00100.1 hypothetical protein C0V70_18710 [Bacteriovorax stolpii]QDK39909.1 hypothetical protein DOM21_00220 [Bacteriovorax stolpii]TDP54007.1 hypothetical protein C8D79_1289 [Bacteriovorax stolpii]